MWQASGWKQCRCRGSVLSAVGGGGGGSVVAVFARWRWHGDVLCQVQDWGEGEPRQHWRRRQPGTARGSVAAFTQRLICRLLMENERHTRTCLTARCPGLRGWAGTSKVRPIWIILKQETVSGSCISWAICKSAPCFRQITTPAPNHSSFLPAGCPSCRPSSQGIRPVKKLSGSCSIHSTSYLPAPHRERKVAENYSRWYNKFIFFKPLSAFW